VAEGFDLVGETTSVGFVSAMQSFNRLRQFACV